MQTVQQIADDIVRREGGYVDDPADPGGATNHGVTLATLARLGRDETGDGQVDRADVKALTAADAATIFIEQYYRKPGLAALPDGLQPSVFDMYVNAGANAVRILQRLLTELGHPVTEDGIVGRETARAARAAAAVDPALLADAYGIARRNYYYHLGDIRPASRKFARRNDGGKGGWITRAEEFISAPYRLTDAQHRARVSAWA
jgi:lysozyme family protein